MHLYIKNVKVLDKQSSWNGQTVNIHIENGKIAAIQSSENAAFSDDFLIKKPKVIEAENAFISIGFIDIGTHTGEPGYEDRDTLATTAKSAAAGGFTGVALMPNTEPVTAKKADIAYILNTTKNWGVQFYPIAAVSEKCEGKMFTEMYELQKAGAVAFSDGKNPIQNGGLLLRALQYVKPFAGVVLNTPHDDALIGGRGLMHEGYQSTLAGMRGAPSLAEELMVQRDLYLNEYADSRLHLHAISCAKSVDLVREAKQKGQKVTASVAIANLVFDDMNLADFDTNFKVTPHLREKSDIDALKKGLKDGTIDIICSNHTPQEEDAKRVEFQFAKFGMLALEACFAAANTFTVLSPEELVEKLAINPRKLLNLAQEKIEIGENANFTLFDTTTVWLFETENNHSKSSNCPWIGMEFKGKIIATSAQNYQK